MEEPHLAQKLSSRLESKRVILGIRDPNRLVSGRGIRFLRKQGVEVVTGVLRRDCEKINESFIKYITTGRPWVILKSAFSLDGKIATRTGTQDG